MAKNKKEKTIEALFIVIDEFDEKPFNDSQSNETLLEILSERVETISTNLG